ncbi:MAG: 4Fe-4S binding protein [Ardenticatenaceae bacterium]|nr:4Fe-4S binding protein [Ardenticatenaceae bacterium]
MISQGTQRIGLYVDDGRCRNCRRCLAQKVCKTKALIRIDHDEPPFIDVHRCLNCRTCLQECPFEAIRSI